MTFPARAGIVGGVIVLAVVLGIAAFVLQRGGSSPAQDASGNPGTDEANASSETLPLEGTTRLTDAERQLAERLAVGIPEVADNLRGKRFQLVGEELAFEKIAPCDQPAARACARVDIFNYTDGHCIQLMLDLENRRPVFVKLDGWCSISSAEVDQARQLAETGREVHQVLQQRHGEFVSGHTVIPHSPIPGHRYIGVGYTLDNGTASAEFVVDLTTQTVCYEC